MAAAALPGSATPQAAVDRVALVEGVPASLRIDQVQALGSHNSYKRYPSAEEDARILALAPAYHDGLSYGHPPIEAQLALGIRQIEIDVAPDPEGGLYAQPYQMAAPASRDRMMAPGAKVLHFPQIDTETHCLTFRDCLTILRHWSDTHPDHLPVTVLVNASDFPPIKGFWLHDAAFDAASLDALDSDILAVMGRERLMTPDDVRGARATLAQTSRDHAWPTLARAKGRFLFVLDGNDHHEALYRTGHASLRGRAMFGYYPEDAPEAAIFNIQDPLGNTAQIARLLHGGFLVRTRADADTQEARAHDHGRADMAIASGAQFVSTDYYDGVPNPQGFDYRVGLPGGHTVRCDPVTAPCPPSPRP